MKHESTGTKPFLREGEWEKKRTNSFALDFDEQKII